MTTPNDDYELLLDYLHGRLADTARQALLNRLSRDVDLRVRLQLVAQEEARIAEWAQSRQFRQAAQQPAAARGIVGEEDVPAPRTAKRPPVATQSAVDADESAASLLSTLPRFFSRRSTSIIAAAAACLIGVVAGIWWSWNRSPGYVATVTRSEEAVWAGDAPPSRCQLGQVLQLTSGRVEVQYRSGPRVVVAGPTRYVISEHAGGWLEWGAVSAEAAPAHRFTIETPQARVVDRGTRFALSVQPEGMTRVHVFDGQVEARTLNEDGNNSIQLPAGHGAEVSARSGIRRHNRRDEELFRLDASLAQKTIEAEADAYIRGGDYADRVPDIEDALLLKRDRWRRLDVCRKAYIRFQLTDELVDPDAEARFAFRHIVRADQTHFRGTVAVYGLKRGFQSNEGLGINWNERRLTWNNAPANVHHSPDDLSDNAQRIGALLIDAGPQGDPYGTSYEIVLPQLRPYLQEDGTVTIILTVADQSDFDPNLHIASRENHQVAGPMLTFQRK